MADSWMYLTNKQFTEHMIVSCNMKHVSRYATIQKTYSCLPPHSWGWSGTNPLLLRLLNDLLYQPWMMNDDECGAIGGIEPGPLQWEAGD
jgi:hypothetical protein